MSSQYDHITNFLIFLSSAPSLWFVLNTSYSHGRHLANRFRLDPENYEVVSLLVAPPSHHLVVPAGCHIASCHPLIVPPSRQLVVPVCCHIASPCPLIALPSRHLVVPAGCRIASCRHLIAPPSRPLFTPAGCCVPSRHAALSSSRFLVVSSCRLSLSCHATGCCTIISCRPLVAPSSRPLIVLAGCCFACPCATLLSSRHSPSSTHQTPSNAAEISKSTTAKVCHLA